LGVPVQGIPVRSTFDSQEVDSVVFNPNENGAGVTSETGETTAVVNFALRNEGTTINYGGTVTFDAGGQQGGATVDFTIDLTCP
jgi:hypothetical protein